MLGQDLVAVLKGRSEIRLTALDRSGLDITDAGAVTVAVEGQDLVINAAGWTDVDGAESAEETATAINGSAVANLAQACAAVGARLVQISTDYVFSGDASSPYAEDAPTAPVNGYGRSKLAGEIAVREHLPRHGYIVRTAWLYGEHGHNFVTTMLDLASRRDTVEVVEDQRGQPTWSLALSRRLVELAERAVAGAAKPGIYHGTASGETTWFGLARAVFEEVGLDPTRVRPTTSAHFPRPARRPSYSVLGHDNWAAAGLAPMQAWRAELSMALRQPGFAALVPAAR
jgi:dTDP-4-dehydrorhamnose reductase